MTDKQLTEVSEGNKVIANFMNWQHHPDPAYDQYEMNNLSYHKDWSALMPVVEKISKLPLLNHDNTPCTDPIDTCYPITFNMPDREQEGNVLFRFKGFSLHSEKTLIGAAWKAVVEVAEYHLNQNKQS